MYPTGPCLPVSILRGPPNESGWSTLFSLYLLILELARLLFVQTEISNLQKRIERVLPRTDPYSNCTALSLCNRWSGLFICIQVENSGPTSTQIPTGGSLSFWRLLGYQGPLMAFDITLDRQSSRGANHLEIRAKSWRLFFLFY
jgi:hypothetical protein